MARPKQNTRKTKKVVKAAKTSPTMSSPLQQVISLLPLLNAEELNQAKSDIVKLLDAIPNTSFPDELSFLNGKCFLHKRENPKEYSEDELYEIVWENMSPSIPVSLSESSGLMYAGTTKYELCVLTIGPMEMAGGFPECDRFPNDAVEGSELFDLLKPHGITTNELFKQFVGWVIDAVGGDYIYLVRYLLDEIDVDNEE